MEKKDEDCESLEEPAFPSESSEKEVRIQWLHFHVQKLVSLVGERWSDFQNSVKKKKFIWKEIATSLSVDGFNVSGKECDRKWRNLKIRYLALREKQMNGMKPGFRVDYYNSIHSFLKDDPATQAYLQQRCSNSIKIKCQKDVDKDDLSEMANNGTMVWTDRSIDLLIKLLLEFKDWFSDKESDRDDRTLWEAISEQMKLEGHRPGPEECHHKWNSLVSTYKYHKSEAEATGTLPLWPYYTRVRHILNNINVPLEDQESQNSLKRRKKGRTFQAKKPKISHIKQEVDSMDEDVTDRSVEMDTDHPLYISGMEADERAPSSLPSEIQELCVRLDRIEENLGVCRRLERLEEKIDVGREQREIQHQTNTLLNEILSELSRLNRNLSTRQQGPNQESGDLSSGITIVVPDSNT
ncbi:uncharacterized protein [Macrobrachium rosenbergii]|uniref:uncharacterized protein n=1 Tax=Macrobrachium rosenbergii TaxID=79674 RepID=UPI0034D7A4CC